MPLGRDWSTLEALKESSKAQLQYSNKWDFQEEDLIEASVESCKLSPYYGWVLDKLVLPREDPNTTHVNGLSSLDVGLDSPKSLPAKLESTSPAPAEIQTEEANQNSEGTDRILESSLIQQSPKAMEVEAAIRMYKEEQRMKLKEELNQRMEMMEQVSKSFAEKAAEQFKRYEEKMELKRRQEQHELQEQLEKNSKEAMEKQEKLKEEHRHKAKLLSLRLREAEQQRQQALERVRQEEGRERMRRLCSLQQEALQLIQQIEVDYKQQESLRLDLSAYSDRGNQICGILSHIVRSSSESGFPSLEDVSMGERSLQEMRALVSSMQREAAAAEEKRKAEEAAAKVKQRQAEVQQDKAQIPVQTQDRGPARKEGIQEKSAKTTMQKYQHFQSVCDQCLQAFSQLSTCKDTQTKKVKAELQKAVTIPVSQISTGPASHLREIFDKLNNFLLGKQMASLGQKVSVTQHPQGMEFACYKLAEKFVKQGEEEVASHHKAAFPIAAVASGIWEAHPRVGDLFLAHLHKKCPYAVPFYPAYKEGTPFEEYQRLLGYRVEDSVAERQDNFLKRMSGMIRLYAAIIQIRWPFGAQQASSHPHGLNHGWTWMSQTLNMEPLVDVTATLLFDFLEVCGNALLKQYQSQFWKMLLLLKDEYLPRIERITSDAQLGSLTRLKLLLEDIFRKREIPLPKGYLPPNFWRT